MTPTIQLNVQGELPASPKQPELPLVVPDTWHPTTLPQTFPENNFRPQMLDLPCHLPPDMPWVQYPLQRWHANHLLFYKKRHLQHQELNLFNVYQELRTYVTSYPFHGPIVLRGIQELKQYAANKANMASVVAKSHQICALSLVRLMALWDSYETPHHSGPAEWENLRLNFERHLQSDDYALRYLRRLHWDPAPPPLSDHYDHLTLLQPEQTETTTTPP
jgi:hypothetical protein